MVMDDPQQPNRPHSLLNGGPSSMFNGYGTKLRRICGAEECGHLDKLLMHKQ